MPLSPEASEFFSVVDPTVHEAIAEFGEAAVPNAELLYTDTNAVIRRITLDNGEISIARVAYTLALALNLAETAGLEARKAQMLAQLVGDEVFGEDTEIPEEITNVIRLAMQQDEVQ